ncbi:MAG: FAD-dependent oxidoreductase, partial [Prolixibacteraceae bacterium]|nr:FAD-dependent oxidoreductase [Prolixibacteraceae bacterium]
WLDIRNLLGALHQYFRQQNILREATFDYEALIMDDDGVSYLNHRAKKIIFCEGTAIARNPWFNKLPFKPARGEILTIRCENFQHEAILNRNGFVLPLGKGLYKVGATFSWDKLNAKPTIEGREQLLQIAQNILNVPFEIVNHEAGIRPASNDRRPVLGKHPVHDQLFVFNGLGSKGVLLAPFFTRHLTAHLYENQALMPEVDVNRYQDHFSLD